MSILIHDMHINPTTSSLQTVVDEVNERLRQRRASQSREDTACDHDDVLIAACIFLDLGFNDSACKHKNW